MAYEKEEIAKRLTEVEELFSDKEEKRIRFTNKFKSYLLDLCETVMSGHGVDDLVAKVKSLGFTSEFEEYIITVFSLIIVNDLATEAAMEHISGAVTSVEFRTGMIKVIETAFG